MSADAPTQDHIGSDAPHNRVLALARAVAHGGRP
jgi:hypothetical protein